MKPSILTVFSLALVVLGASPAAAFQLEPMSRVFAPTGSSATQSFEISNTTGAPVAVLMSVVTLTRDDDYVESNADAGDDFLIYPTQIVIRPGARQTVRVTWLGDPRPAHDRTYRLIAEQVPLGLLDRTASGSHPKGQLEILTTFRGTLFIRPPSATPRVSVEHVVSTSNGARIAVMVRNTGGAAAIVARCKVKLVFGETIVELGAAELGALANTRILAGTRRRYLVAAPAGLPARPLTSSSGTCDVKP